MFNINSKEIQPLDNQVNKSISTEIKVPFSAMICGSKGAGKTNLILNLLLKPVYLRNKFNKCIFISPTAIMDSKINVLRNEEFLTPNKKLYNLLKKLKKKQKIISDDDDIIPYSDIPRSLTDDDFLEDFDIQFLSNLLKEQKYIITNYGKEYADNILIIIDDLAGQKFFKSTFMKKFLFNSRHHKLSIIINTQAYFLVDKSIRLNNSLLLLFETGNEEELKLIYQENSCNKKFKEWLEIYKYVIEKPFNFMTINYQTPSTKYRFMTNLEYFIQNSK